MNTESTGGFSTAERKAMKERAAELKKASGHGGRGDRAARQEHDLLAKIEGMDPADRALAERIHTLVTTTAPDLEPKLWYGQPAYARKGKVVCFFRSGNDDKERYSTFGFTPEAGLDDDSGLWATSFALTRLSQEAEHKIVSLLERAAT